MPKRHPRLLEEYINPDPLNTPSLNIRFHEITIEVMENDSKINKKYSIGQKENKNKKCRHIKLHHRWKRNMTTCQCP